MIRWPVDALLFSTRAGRWLIYDAGYVEADVGERLGAGAGPDGTELVGVRSVVIASEERIELLRTEQRMADEPDAGLVPIRDMFFRDVGGPAVVEALVGNVNARDLVRQAHRNGTPPPGLIVYVAKRIAEIMHRARGVSGCDLVRSPESTLFGWDGRVFLRPVLDAPLGLRGLPDTPAQFVARVAVGLLLPTRYRSRTVIDDEIDRLLAFPRWETFDAFDSRASAAAIADNLERGREQPDFPHDVADVVSAFATEQATTLEHALRELDVLAGTYPFDARDCAGLLANLFPEDRATDVEFREDLAACAVDDVVVPVMGIAPLTRETFKARVTVVR